MTDKSLYRPKGHLSKGIAMGTLIEKRKAAWDSMMKSSISEAAISVLNEFGFDGLRMDRVAKAAEVAKGTLYNYFENKDELVLNVMEMKFEPIYRELLKIHNSESSPPDKIENIIRTLLSFLEDERALLIVITAAEGLSLAVKNSADTKREIVINLIAGITEEGIEQGFFRKINTIHFAKMIYGAIHATFHIKITDENNLQSYKENDSDIIELFFLGLLKKD
jgi:AcrR family transcriptional regulator